MIERKQTHAQTSGNFHAKPIIANSDTSLYMPGTSSSPMILFDDYQGKLFINGNSTCQNPDTVYNELIFKLANYIFNDCPNSLNANFRFKKISSRSMNPIIRLLKLIKFAKRKGLQVDINWHHEKKDEDMISEGEFIEEVLSQEMNFVAY